MNDKSPEKETSIPFTTYGRMTSFLPLVWKKLDKNLFFALKLFLLFCKLFNIISRTGIIRELSSRKRKIDIKVKNYMTMICDKKSLPLKLLQIYLNSCRRQYQLFRQKFCTYHCYKQLFGYFLHSHTKQ